MSTEHSPSLPGSQAEALLRELSTWRPTTTIIIHCGCVFEFKGPFPPGTIAEGYYNLEGTLPGFHGHIRLDVIDHIGFQQQPHRGRESYAFVFTNFQGEKLFKVFLGRDNNGQIFPEQIDKFHTIRERLAVNDL